MAGFSERFQQYLPPDDERVGRALTKGLVVLDANVLLDAYRYASDARAELLRVLQSLGDRLWVPHQVALEFHRNRVSVISSHGDSYRDVLKATQEFRQRYDSELAKQLREFANRVALPDEERVALIRHVESGLEALASRLNELQAIHGISDRFVSRDPVLKQLQQLLDNKVGPPLSTEEEATARQEAQRRIENQLPPGFKDMGKDDPCGDFLVWHQSLLEAKARSVPLLFITRDTKEDWFLRVKGKTISALPELILEAQQVAGVDFVALTTKTFLVHSQRFLATEVSKTTLEQTEAISRTSRKLNSKDRQIVLLPEAAQAILRDLDADQRALTERKVQVERALLSPELDKDDRQKLENWLRVTRRTEQRLEYASRVLLSGIVLDDGTIRVDAVHMEVYMEISRRLKKLSTEDPSKGDERSRETQSRKIWSPTETAQLSILLRGDSNPQDRSDLSGDG